MFLGQGKAGKSATVRSVLDKKFRPEWDSTVGVDVTDSKLSDSNRWGEEDQKVDFTAIFATRIMSKRYKESKNKDIQVVNIPTSKKKRKSTRKRVSPAQSLEHNCQTLDNEKNDFKPLDTISKPRNKEKLQIFDIIHAYDNEMLLRAHSKRNELALSLWDFGGQEVFYTMHHIFLTQTGIYVLIFDTRQLLDIKTREESKQYVLFWLRSINLHAPDASVILVGTFCAEIHKGIRTVNKIVRELCRVYMAQVKPNGNLNFFPIDNKEGLNIKELRTAIESTAREDQSIKQQVWIRWMAFLDDLLSHKDRVSYLTMSSTVNEIAMKFGLSNQERDMALQLFHERGLIIHLTATEALRNFVVIKPQWLIDALTKVIRDHDVHVDLEEFRKVFLEDDATELFSQGIASRDLLEYLWDHEQVDFFIDLMKRTMLLSEYRDCDHFLIPSLLQHDYTYDNTYNCKFDFSETYLLHGMFQRLVCLCVEYVSRESVTNASFIIRKNFAQFERFRGQSVELSEQNQMITLNTSGNTSDIIAIIQSMLSKTNNNVMNGRLKWRTLALDESTGRFELWQEKLQAVNNNLNLDSFLNCL